MARTWEDEELTILRKMSGRASSQEMLGAINELAKKRGWTERTLCSLLNARGRYKLQAGRWQRPIRCVETKAVYKSASKASEAFYVHPTAIRRAAKDGSASAGYHWEYVDES